MREQMLTPLDLWRDYSPSSEKLQVNILKQTADEKKRVRLVYISGATDNDDMRIALKVVYPADAEVSPCFFYIPGFDLAPNNRIIDNLIKNGIAVITFDYLGRERPDMPVTKYEKGLSFAEAPQCFDVLESAYPTVRNSPWYVWSLAARRVLYYIANDQMLSDKVMVYGENEGSMMAWHVAAFDDTITCLAQTGGFYPASIEKIENKAPLVPDNLRWIAGLTPEAYVQYVKCPVLTMAATNSSAETLERHDRMMMSLPADTIRYLTLTPMSERELSQHSFNTLLQFALKYLTGAEKVDFPESLELQTEQGEKYCKFSLQVPEDEKFFSVQLYFSTGISHPKFRCWRAAQMKKDKGEYSVILDTSNMSDKLVVFASAVRGGCAFSTPVEYIALQKIKVRNDNRILFDGRQGNTGTFTSKTGGLFWADTDCKLKKGPFDIEGLSSEKGVLQSFVLQDESFKPSADSLLTFDAYSEKDAEFILALYSEDGYRYQAECSIKGGGGWQKIKLVAEDFKRDNRISADSWKDIIKISFENMRGIIINNILWL